MIQNQDTTNGVDGTAAAAAAPSSVSAPSFGTEDNNNSNNNTNTNTGNSGRGVVTLPAALPSSVSSSDAEESSDDDYHSDHHGGGDGQLRIGRMEHRRRVYDNLTATQAATLNYAMENRIFLKAMLALLQEREQTATEIRNTTAVVFKCGPLRKASPHLVTGVWKMKYVEIRKGMFTYFEDMVSSSSSSSSSGNGGGNTTSTTSSGGSGSGEKYTVNSNMNTPTTVASAAAAAASSLSSPTSNSSAPPPPPILLQKNIPLDANETTVRAVKIHRNGLNLAFQGAILELRVGKIGRLWLAKSNEERRKWIQAINDAMVGRSITASSTSHTSNSNNNSTKNPGIMSSATTSSSTTNTARSPYKEDLKVYVKVQAQLKSAKSKQEYLQILKPLSDRNGNDPLHIPVRFIIEQLGKSSHNNTTTNTGGDTSNTSMPGEFVETSMNHSIEQLWRDLSRDQIRINNDLFDGNSGHGTEKIIGALTRCIVAVSRSDYSQNYRYAIPEAKALAYARDILLSINRTRSGGDSYFCINTLSSNPDLVVLVPSSRPSEPLSITVEFDESDCFFADCSANDKSGWIRTRNRIQKSWRKRFFVLSEGTLSFYRYDSPIPHGFRKQDVISDATISVDVAKDHPGYYVISIGPKNDAIQERYLYFNCMNKLISWTHALECMAKSPSNGLGRRKGTTSCTEIRQKIEQAMRTHLTTLGFNSTDIEQRLARLSAKSFSRVRISAHASQEYNICTKDPDGVDDDTWATTTATFCQSFRITSGRIVCGEEIVQIDVSGIGAAPDDVATTDKKNGVEDDVNDDENNKNNNNHGNQSNNDGPFSPTRRMLTLPRRKRSSFTDNTGK